MKYEQHFSLIKRLEKEAEQNPRSYKFRVTALAVLGYAYFLLIGVVPLVIAVAAALAVWFVPGLLWLLIKVLGKLILLLAAMVVGVAAAFAGALRSFFVEAVPPEGCSLKREEAPKLFELVDEVSDQLAAPRPDHVLIGPAFNASVHTLPRRGIFGRVTYLNIGLPLLQALSPEQFRAVLAHEMGHISKKHGSDATWVYQLRESWARFLEGQETSENTGLTVLYAGFVNWYFPYFNAYSFVLARQQEREADRMAAELYGRQPLAEALMNCEVRGQLLENEFWRNVFAEARSTPQPPDKTFSRMAHHFRTERDETEQILALSKALAAHTDYHDTHPSLNERLRLIGYAPAESGQAIPAVPSETAAESYLGSLNERLIEKFDREWQTSIAPVWAQHHEYLRQVCQRLTELEGKAKSAELTTDELYELANLKAQNEDNQAAVPILRQMLAKDPQNAAAKFTLGSILLENDEAAGVELLEEAMAADIFYTVQASEQIYAFWHARGEEERALPYLKRAESFQEDLIEAQKERENVTDLDEYEAHDLPAESVAAIRAKIAIHEEIAVAYLVRKKVRLFPEKPFYVLGLQTKRKWFRRTGVKDEHLLEVVIRQVEPLEVNSVLVLNKFKHAHKQMQQLPGSRIFES